MTALFAAPDIARTDRADGSILLRSRDPLAGYPPSVGHWLRRWAADEPDRVFLAERPDGDPSRPWDTLSYGEVYDRARALGQALLEKTEIRIAGDGVTPGYLKSAEQTADAFDDEGYYVTGDAVRLADPDDANAGLVFDGRIAEDFKLTTGSWVSVGTLRPAVLSALAPLVSDCVVTGHNRDWLGLLAWPAAPHMPADADLVGALRQRLVEHNEGAGSSRRIRRLALLTEPPSIDLGETTDKGYINQRAVLEHRAEVVERLYRDDPPPDIVVIE